MGQTFEVKTWNISISSHLHENSGSSKFELPICASGNPGSSKFELPGFAKQRIFQNMEAQILNSSFLESQG